MFWGWLRKRLRALDLIDMRKKRKPLGKRRPQNHSDFDARANSEQGNLFQVKPVLQE